MRKISFVLLAIFLVSSCGEAPHNARSVDSAALLSNAEKNDLNDLIDNLTKSTWSSMCGGGSVPLDYSHYTFKNKNQKLYMKHTRTCRDPILGWAQATSYSELRLDSNRLELLDSDEEITWLSGLSGQIRECVSKITQSTYGFELSEDRLILLLNSGRPAYELCR